MRGRRLRMPALAALVFALLGGRAVVAQQQQQQPPIQIKDVTVEGNRRVQEAVILGRVQSKPGATFIPSAVSEDVRSIFQLGFFDDVQVRVEDFEGGIRLTFVVSERPFVRDVDFTGNKKVSTATLQEKVDVKLGSVYNPVDIQRAVETLKNHYEEEGYFEVQISPEAEKFPDGDVRVVFHINEGRRITIDRIVFRGNIGLTPRQLKAVMATQERQYYILRGTIQRQRLDENIDRILALYGDHGYIQARVESQEVTVDRDKARAIITITVVEGPQYTVGEVKATGVNLVPETEIQRQFLLKSGEVFSRTKLRDTIKNLTDLYSTIGRASVDINPRTQQSPTAPILHVTLDINEGPEVYVERINISGNLRSEDKILRREVPMVEGDLFTLQKMQRARQRLINLGYFDKVDVTTAPGADRTKIIVNVEVTEKPTGLFSIGGGFSSVDGFVGTIDLSQRNFLGRGWELTLRLRGGAQTQQGIISFTEPWLFDRPISAGFDLFDTTRKYTDYDYETVGGQLRMSRPFLEYWRWNLVYRLTRDRISGLSDSASPELKAEEGTRITSLVSAGVTRDSRDNITAPTKGGQFLMTVDVAGLGGDTHFLKTVSSVTYFKPIWFNHILSGRAEIGYGFGFGKEEFPLFERFYLGGPNTLRGFKFRTVSPEDEFGNRTGGTTELLGNIEYIVPMPFNIRLAAFFDIGNVYGFRTPFDPTDLRTSGGAGVRWLSPFGPIRVDYGINLDRRKNESFGEFQFSVGSPF
ncbi:MAG TPA: outer membrane protein assembly factor BamA [Methylomirabilota bacterium]|jgi:outer membrane protein insertion porin family